MIFVAVIAMCLVACLGLVIKLVLHSMNRRSRYSDYPYHISWSEFSISIVLMALIVTPSVLTIGSKLSVDNIVRYEQFVNGVETHANRDITTCYAGTSGSSASSGQSNCKYTYESGTYTWIETYFEPVCTSDAKGNSSCTQELRTRPVVSSIYTPYATRENRYSIDSSVGFKELPRFNFPGVYLDANPQPYGNRPVLDNIPRGAPSDWLDAKSRLDAGDPRSVTALDSYDNYILASDDEVLKTYSARIEEYRSANLLPAHTANIMDDPIDGTSHSQASKVSFVGVSVPDPQAWQRAVMRFNAALGMKFQGDLHVVLINSASVPANDAVPYINALKAYWQSPEFDKRALAKNGIILVLGVSSNSSIEWAQASTGMPFGNELMSNWVKDYLPGVELTPQAIFGSPRTVIDGANKAVIAPSATPGMLERIVFTEAPFKRARMSCDDGSCVGYKDLLSRIEPTTGQKIWMVIIILLCSGGVWYWVGASRIIERLLPSRTSRYESYSSEHLRPNERFSHEQL